MKENKELVAGIRSAEQHISLLEQLVVKKRASKRILLLFTEGSSLFCNYKPESVSQMLYFYSQEKHCDSQTTILLQNFSSCRSFRMKHIYTRNMRLPGWRGRFQDFLHVSDHTS